MKPAVAQILAVICTDEQQMTARTALRVVAIDGRNV